MDRAHQKEHINSLSYLAEYCIRNGVPRLQLFSFHSQIASDGRSFYEKKKKMIQPRGNIAGGLLLRARCAKSVKNRISIFSTFGPLLCSRPICAIKFFSSLTLLDARSSQSIMDDAEMYPWSAGLYVHERKEGYNHPIRETRGCWFGWLVGSTAGSTINLAGWFHANGRFESREISA